MVVRRQGVSIFTNSSPSGVKNANFSSKQTFRTVGASKIESVFGTHCISNLIIRPFSIKFKNSRKSSRYVYIYCRLLTHSFKVSLFWGKKIVLNKTYFFCEKERNRLWKRGENIFHRILFVTQFLEALLSYSTCRFECTL